MGRRLLSREPGPPGPLPPDAAALARPRAHMPIVTCRANSAAAASEEPVVSAAASPPTTAGGNRALPCHPRASHALRYSCCGPMTLPGRTIRSQPMASSALNPACFINQRATSVPVRPSPARQWTATAPLAASQMSRKRSTIASVGTVQSLKYSSW